MKKLILFSVIYFLSVTVQSQNLKDPVYNFDYLWQTYKDNYKMFAVKHINWDSLYNVYRPMIDHNSSDEKLFSVLSKLMYHLNDSHCWLEDSTTFYKSGTNVTYPLKDWDTYWNKYHTGNFSLTLIESSYLNSGKFKKAQNGNFQYGWLKDSIGYFHFNAFTGPLEIRDVMDSILTDLASAKSIIIDLRSNAGGHEEVNKQILDRFADRRRLYLVEDSNAYYVYKGDAKYNRKSFRHTEPRGKIRYTRPIIVLTDKTTYSSADIIASGFKEMSQTCLIGVPTNGCTANMYMMHLPNGWSFTIAMGIAYTAEGKCIDGGIGVTPDIFIQNSEKDIRKGKDKMLERAIEEATDRKFKRVKETDYSLLNSKPPQIDEIFINLLLENKTEDAFNYLKVMYNEYPLLCEQTIVEEKISSVAWDFIETGQHETGLEIFKWNNKIFPYSPNTIFNIGEAYEIMGQPELTLLCYREVRKMDPGFRSNFYIPIDGCIEEIEKSLHLLRPGNK